MNDRTIARDDLPAEIDFSKGVRSLHHIPAGAKILTLTPASERQVITQPETPTDDLKPDIENQ